MLFGNRFDQVEQDFKNHLTQTESNQTLHQNSPRFGVNFKASEQWAFYSNYGRSFAMNSSMNRNGQTFAPEKGESYEVGTKYKINDQSVLSLALFEMKNEMYSQLTQSTVTFKPPQAK